MHLHREVEPVTVKCNALSHIGDDIADGSHFVPPCRLQHSNFYNTVPSHKKRYETQPSHNFGRCFGIRHGQTHRTHKARGPQCCYRAAGGERGYAAFNMEAIADKAGVSKSTLYRHWPTKVSLIADALNTLNVQPRPGPADGTVRERVTILLRHLTEALTASPFASCIPGLIEATKHHPEVADFLYDYSARRRERLVALLRDGVAAGGNCLRISMPRRQQRRSVARSSIAA
ncbi:TetR/AcrR family transcriptional regulator [Roseibium salinum]|nr:TetR/AcrR family transcriptional regulator [Roseibium salinum]